jgi:uncharacterized membrane protein YfcA
VTLGAALQSAGGFGFALTAAPVLTATVGPRASVSALSLLGLVIAGMTIAGERRRPAVLVRPAAVLLAWALPGMALGVLALEGLGTRTLKVAVALAILGAVAAQAITSRRRGAPPPRHDAAAAAAAGVTAGALTTSVGMNGPPLVLYLLRTPATPGQVRDTMAALFLATSLLAVGVLAVAGSFDPPGETAGLFAAVIVGQLVGARVFRQLAGDRFQQIVLAAIAVLALVSLGLALL